MSTRNPEHLSNTILDRNAERSYWRDQLESEPYYDDAFDFDDYQHAYRAGYEGFDRHAGKSFDQVEHEVKSDWERTKGESRLTWEKARHATRAAWHRLERAMPGDADGDGR